MSRTVLITGAAGDTGRAAVRESLKRGMHVRALVHRKDDRSAALERLGAEIALGDLHRIDGISRAMQGADAAYFVYPVAPGVIEATVNFAQAAKEAGIAAVVNLSQRSASRTSTSWSCQETWICEQVLNWSGLNVTHLRPTYFLEWLLYPWQLPLLQEKGIIRLPVGKASACTNCRRGSGPRDRIHSAESGDTCRANLPAIRSEGNGSRPNGCRANRSAWPENRFSKR